MVQKSRTKIHLSSRYINNTLYFKGVARNRTITDKLVAVYLKLQKIYNSTIIYNAKPSKRLIKTRENNKKILLYNDKKLGKLV